MRRKSDERMIIILYANGQKKYSHLDWTMSINHIFPYICFANPDSDTHYFNVLESDKLTLSFYTIQSYEKFIVQLTMGF
jgi:hypothetical protein